MKKTTNQGLRKMGMLLFAAGALWPAKPVEAAGANAPLDVVPQVDLNRYAGKRYEIARLPNRFQRDCVGGTTATYTLRPDGKITVLNQCRTDDGRVKSAKGTARIADPKGPNSKLKVTFFWPFSGKYWIINLDPQYRWAVVGEPSRKYLWVLSRTPHLDPELYEDILKPAHRQGFDTAKLLKTPQS